MATREENLKKINEQLELLSDEQLDEIAGGRKTPGRWFTNTEVNQQNQNPAQDVVVLSAVK